MDSSRTRPRIASPAAPDAIVTLAPPPRLSVAPPPLRVVPMLWAPVVAGAGFLLVILASRGGPLALAMGLVFFVAAVGLASFSYAASWWAPKRTVRLERASYLRHVDELRQRVGQAAREQRQAAVRSHPAPRQLLDVARSERRRFERGSDAADFGRVRVGLGTVDLALRLVDADTDPLAARDPISVAAAADLKGRPHQLDDVPITVDVTAGITTVVGPAAATRESVRAMVCQTAVFHDPDDIRFAVARHRDNIGDWEWVKWLPHIDMVTDQITDVANLLADEVAARIAGRRGLGGSRLDPVKPPRLVVVVDSDRLPARDLDFRSHGVGLAELDIYLVHLVADEGLEPSRVDQRVRLDRTTGVVERGDAGWAFRPDPLPTPVADMLARQLAARAQRATPRRPIATTWIPSLRRVDLTGADIVDDSQGLWPRHLVDSELLCAPFATYEPTVPARVRRPGVLTTEPPTRPTGAVPASAAEVS